MSLERVYELRCVKMRDDKITRRSALKRIGLAMAGAFVSSTGLLSLSSCENKELKKVILYFTGTGNCLYVARQLGNGNAELLSIPQLMKQDVIEIEADEIGIVYPIYGHMPPNMVRQFIKKARLKADYKYAVLTYGNRKCNAVEIWNNIARQAGIKFDYINTLIMVDNWLPNFDMNEQILIDKHIPDQLERISGDISSRRDWHQPVSDEERMQHQEFLARTGINPEIGFMLKSGNYFTVTDACIGCGACVAVCPKGNYSMSSQGVKTDGNCEFCFACIQNCPQKAIQFVKNENDPFLNKGEKNPNARYRNEHISLMDIKRANSQF